jgi:Mg-chelatase subunit ChlD
MSKSAAPYAHKAQRSPVETPLNNEPVSHSECFKIVVVLDESGSMNDIRRDMIKALNDIITEQKQISDRPCKFTLVKFNDTVSRVVRNLDLNEVRKLTNDDYRPDRTTALYDAIGDTVNWFRYESDVLMVIVTDGRENASHKYTHKQVTDMLDEKKKHRKWTYVYLSNDLSTKVQGDSLGLQKSRSVSNCVVDQYDYGEFLSNKVNKSISAYRTNGVSVQQQLNNA